MNLGENIKQLCKDKNITEKELAKLVGVTDVAISRYVMGIREPKGAILMNIAEVLNTDIYTLTGKSFPKCNCGKQAVFITLNGSFCEECSKINLFK